MNEECQNENDIKALSNKIVKLGKQYYYSIVI